ncbi:MAG: hypothetical protein KJN64_04960, partial [Ignavibacteria bacterium]|nr:hypothetical protein [Ignavibacteria bacterium]
MGYTTLLDILGSIIVGGILMMIAWRLSEAATEKTYNTSGELSMQQNLATVAQIIEHDFRKIGYCDNHNKIPDPSKAITFADTSSLKFLTDVDSDGTVDSIFYYLGPTSELLSTPNPRDRILYRVVNNEAPIGSNLGVTRFFMVYYDALNDSIPTPITTPGIISSVEINVTVEQVAAYVDSLGGYSELPSAFWRQI